MRKFSLLLSNIVVLALALTACGGQQTSTSVPSTSVPPVTVESTSTTAATEAPSTTGTAGVPVTGAENPSRVSKLMDFPVMDQTGNQVATASDLVIDLDNSRVAYVVVSTTSGSNTVLIPWDSLQLQSQAGAASGSQNAFVLLADPNFLQNAPNTDLTSILPQMCQAAGNWDADIRSFWQSGAVPGTPSTNGTATSASGTGTGTGTGTETATQSAVVASTATSSSGTATPTTSSGTGTTAGTATATTGTGTGNGQGNAAGQGGQIQGVVLASQVIGSSINIGPGIGNGQGTGNGTGNGNATAMPNGTATSTTGTGGTGAGTATATATPGTGAGTGTGNTGFGNMTATIQDLIIDMATGDVRYAVISTADHAQNWIPVPLAMFRCDTANNALMTIASANALQTAPFFTEDQFPDTSTTGWDQQWMDFWQSNGGTGTDTGTGTGAATPTTSSGTGTGTETATATP